MTAYLLDTGALLKFLDDPVMLSREAQDILADPSQRVLASAASFFELAVKKALKKTKLPDNLPEIVCASGLEILPLQPEHSWKTVRLPYHHTDPYDRLLIAQAVCNDLTIITQSPHFQAYGIATIKA